MGRDERRSETIRGALWAAGTLVAAAVVVTVASTGPARTCADLWNAPDNAVVRRTVADRDYRLAAITAYTVDGPGRLCYVTVFDRRGSPALTFVIWPDNLFDNGSLHDYSSYGEGDGYLGHPLDREPSMTISRDGRIQT